MPMTFMKNPTLHWFSWRSFIPLEFDKTFLTLGNGASFSYFDHVPVMLSINNGLAHSKVFKFEKM